MGQQIQLILDGLQEIGSLAPEFALWKQEAFSIECFELIT